MSSRHWSRCYGKRVQYLNCAFVLSEKAPGKRSSWIRRELKAGRTSVFFHTNRNPYCNPVCQPPMCISYLCETIWRDLAFPARSMERLQLVGRSFLSGLGEVKLQPYSVRHSAGIACSLEIRKEPSRPCSVCIRIASC